MTLLSRQAITVIIGELSAFAQEPNQQALGLLAKMHNLVESHELLRVQRKELAKRAARYQRSNRLYARANERFAENNLRMRSTLDRIELRRRKRKEAEALAQVVG